MKLSSWAVVLLASLSFFIAPSYGNNMNANMFVTPWTFDCSPTREDGVKVCLFEKSMFQDDSQKTKIATLVFSVTNAKGAPPLFMTVISPLGTLLAPGIGIAVGSKTAKLPFLFCDQKGCVSQVNLDEKWINSFFATNEVKLKYALMNNQEAQLVFNVEGFKDAFNKTQQSIK